MKARCSFRALFTLLSLLFINSKVFAQPAGATINNAINFGTIIPGTSYSDTKNNSPSNGFQNNMGQASDDIYYKFTLSSYAEVKLSHCSSGFDTYLHLLNSTGVLIYSNDDNGPLCTGNKASIIRQLSPGTYYVVSEGYSTFTGSIITQVSISPPAGTTLSNPINLGVLSKGIPYSDTKNNSVSNGYLNNIGHASDDIYYKFTLPAADEINISHCVSEFDTFVHLLDASGNLIYSNDDDGPLCTGVRASIKRQLSAGTYYVVSEGYGTNSGNITTEIYSSAMATSKCGTPPLDSIAFEKLPYYDNNDYLEYFLDSIGYPRQPGTGSSTTTQSFVEQTKYWIPIKLWIVRDDNGVGGPTEAQQRTLLQGLNARFSANNTNMQFYYRCTPAYINNSSYLSSSDTEARSLSRNNEDKNAVNVFIVDDLEGAFGAYYYSFFLSFDSFKSIFVTKSTYDNPTTNTFTHEIGHYFGLNHTHEFEYRGRCRREPIDRSRKYAGISYCKPFGTRIMCESTGDGLRDTPADPDISGNSTCEYRMTSPATDHFGDSYLNPPPGSSRPSARNIMSYNGNRTCRTEFSRLQVAVMLMTLQRYTPQAAYWRKPEFKADIYEPDNTRNTFSEINVGEVQVRNFNVQYNGSSNSNTSCDEDWVHFYSGNSAGYVDFYTSNYISPQANTVLSLYDINNNLLASNDDKASGDIFSKFTYNISSYTNYFLKVTNKNVGGFYSLGVGPPCPPFVITGPDSFCGNANYQVNLPPDGSVSWTASGGISISGSASANPVQVSYNGSSSTGIITATVTSLCGQSSISKGVSNATSYTVYYSGGASGTITGSGTNVVNGQTYSSYSLSVSPNNANSSNNTYSWYVRGGTGYSSLTMNGTSASFYLSGDYPSIALNLTVTNPNCGKTESILVFNGGSQSGAMVQSSFTIFPNPTTDELTISPVIVMEGKNEKAIDKTHERPYKYKIYDRKGLILKEGEAKNGGNVKIDLRNLPNDNYFLHIVVGDEKIISQIVVQH